MPDNVEFVWTPTNAAWLNLIEPWFLGPGEDRVAQPDLKTTQAIAEHLLQGIDYLNEHPRPYQWRKAP
jgi:hypothetical protein